MTFSFRQGLDYGPRSGTRGIGYHMAEGGDGVLTWLSRRTGESIPQWGQRVNGVSCHVVILSTGKVWQMVDWDNVCGNLNPDHRRGDSPGYYSHHHLREILGNGWTNPNEWHVSAELAGFRAAGPTKAQVVAAIDWGLEMREMFPSIRGAFGHHDQSTKPCPGLTPNMKAIFAGVGGHGLWKPDITAEPQGDDVGFQFAFGTDAAVTNVTGKTDKPYEYLDANGDLQPFSNIVFPKRAIGPVHLKVGIGQTAATTTAARSTGYFIGEDAVFVLATDVNPDPVVAVDCGPVADAAVGAALDKLTAPVAALATAIEDARS